jgi:hypothetical protein
VLITNTEPTGGEYDLLVPDIHDVALANIRPICVTRYSGDILTIAREDSASSVNDLHSQFAFSGLRIFKTSIERRPCDVASMIFGSTPISVPILLLC